MNKKSLPAMLFGLAAGLSLVLSVVLWFFVDKGQGMFVGLWVPSILALGALLIANKNSSSNTNHRSQA